MTIGKRLKKAREGVDREKLYALPEAIKMVKERAKSKFDETIEVAINLGVDPRHADQMVRGVVTLPNGTGRTLRVGVFARGAKADEARAAGADVVGAEDLVEKVQAGNIDFDRCIATPDMMPLVGRLGKVLGPRGMMPNPKIGTVTMDVATAVKGAKGGSVEFRVEKAGIVQAGIGKASFSEEKLVENVKALTDAVAKAIVLKNEDPFVSLLIERKRGETQLFAKEVTVEGRRYVVCRNEAEAEKDRRDLQAIVAALQDALRRGEKALIGNAGYRRYLRKRSVVRGEPAFEIDAGKLAEEARFDGIFVLRTNADVTPLQAVLRYRELLQIEQLFRQSKAVFDTRPIFHSSDAAIRGHVFCTFLALLLQKQLNDLARNAGSNVEWRTLLRELDQLSQARVRSSEKDWLIRTDATPAVAAILRQASIALPPRARQTFPPKPPPPRPAHRRRGRPRRSATPS